MNLRLLKLQRKFRREIAAVMELSLKNNELSQDLLMQEKGWCRTKAYTVLEVCRELGVIKLSGKSNEQVEGSKP